MKLNPVYTMTPEPSVPVIPWYDHVISWFALAWWRHRALILLLTGTLLATLPITPWGFVGTGYFLALAVFGLVCIREVLRLVRTRAKQQ